MPTNGFRIGRWVIAAMALVGCSARDPGRVAAQAEGSIAVPRTVEDARGRLGPETVLVKLPDGGTRHLWYQDVEHQYAADCFNGTFQACDDLLYESPPLSEYEDYAITCGGRVKQWDVMACTDLE